MKKRILISFFLTILIAFLTNKYWLHFKPVPVKLNISGIDKSCYVEIQLNKRNNNSFYKIKEAQTTLDLNKTKEAYFDINIKSPKRIRIIIANIKNPVKISEINIKRKLLPLDDVKNFSSNTNFSIKNNEIFLAPPPKDNYIELIYNKKLNLRAAIKFDFEIFLIIVILTFLLSYKITNYIANFNTIKNQPKTEIIFLCIFFIFLFIPMSKINKDEININENRALAKWKPLLQGKEINYDFGSDFNKWFSDRFNLRDYFVSLYDYRYLLQKNILTNHVIVGKDGWLFFARSGSNSIETYTNSNLYTQEELEKIDKYLANVDKFCKENNKQFYFVIAPNKFKVYEEFYSDLIKPSKKDSIAQQLIKYTSNHSKVKILYLKDTLRSNKDKGLLYYKKDTHWNTLGAYYGYLSLMDFINQNSDDKFYIYKAQNYKEEKYFGDLHNMLPKEVKSKKEDEYIIPDLFDRNGSCEETIDTNYIWRPFSCSNPKQEKKLALFSDSYTYNLLPFLSESFNSINVFFQPSISCDLIKDADIVMLELVERNLPKLGKEF